jgi:general secretion pathway protein L
MTRLVFLSGDEGVAPRFLDLDDAGAPIRKGHKGEASNPARTVVVIPGADVVTHWLELPLARAPGQVLAAAKRQLEERIATPVEAIHIAFGALGEDGLRPVSIVERGLLRNHLARAAAAGIVPDCMLPDYFLLGVPDGESATVTAFGPTRAARARRLAFTAEADLAQLMIAGRSVEVIESPEDLAAMFADAAAAPAVDLLQFEFAPKRRLGLKRKDFVRAAAMAGALLLSPLVLWTAEILRHEAGAMLLNSRAKEIARSAFPSRSSGEQTLAMRAFVADVEAGDRLLAATAALFDAVASIPGARLDAFSYRQDGDLRATLIHERSQDIASLVARLERSGFAIRQDGTERRDATLSTAFSLELRS